MKVLGLNAYHADAAACIIDDGNIIAAAEEERFRRIKHWAGFPSQAIQYCLNEANLSLSNIDIIAINTDPSRHFLRKLFFTLRHRPNIKFILDRAKNQKAKISIEQELKYHFPETPFKGTLVRTEHHLTHLASSFYLSSFDEALCISVDGFGDFSSSAVGIGHNNKIDIQKRIFFPHSLGIFYQALTQYLRFLSYGDEYKVMGLAPYGKPTYVEKMRNIVKLTANGFLLNPLYFRHLKEKIPYTWQNGIPHIGTLYTKALVELLGPERQKDEKLTQRHFDIAHSTQVMYEEAFFHLLTLLHEKFPIDQLALAGGCAMNSVANGKITEKTPFKKTYIPAAAGDAGCAIGAALVAQATHSPKINAQKQRELAYFGPRYTNSQIENVIKNNEDKLEKTNFSIQLVQNENQLCDVIADAISQGKVIGWFHGRMEWGPRALGNRSILSDARRQDMKDILNLKIKHRESFRPFAPSILREYVSDWFEIDDDVPFMGKVFKIKTEKRALIPAVTHVDGTGRLQTVAEAINPRYYKLIKTFFEKTTIPILLNTSFNENEPVVCRPEEALDCFLRTKMDVLVMEDWVIGRN